MFFMAASTVAFSQPAADPPVEDAAVEQDSMEQEMVDSSGFQPAKFELTLRGWSTDFEADSTLLREVFGVRVDVADELGLDPDTIPEIRLRWRFAKHHSFTAAYLGIDESADRAILRPFVLDDGVTAPFGALKADLNLDYFRLGWRWEIGGRKSDKFDLETILDVAIFDLEASYRHNGLFLPFFLSSEDSVDETVAIPLIGLRAEGRPFKHLGIYGEVAGMIAGDYGDIVDLEFGVRGYLGKHLTLEGGYRYFSINGSDGDDEADVTLDGPFLGVGLRF